MAGSEVLDKVRVELLKSTLDDKGLSSWEKSYRFYAQTAPIQAEQIRNAVAARNFDLLCKTAWSLKSASSNLGAKRLSAICLALETAGRNQDFSRSQVLLLEFNIRFLEVLTALKGGLHYTTEAYPVNTGLTKTGADAIPAAKIMVVDDDPNFRMILADTLQVSGYTIFEAHSGNDALNKLKQQTDIDLIILDANMDDMDGFETCEALRSDPDREGIPIIMSTGLNDVESVNRAFKAGASDFIAKPVNLKLLAHHIRFLLRSSEYIAGLRKNKSQLSQAQRIARLGYWTWHAEQNKIEISPYLAEMCKLSPYKENFGEALKCFTGLIHPEDRSLVENAIYTTLDGRKNTCLDYRLIDDEGNITLVNQETALISENIVTGTVQDITRLKESEIHMYQLAYHDKLTGLSNRTFYQLHIGSVINMAKRHNKQLGLLFLDLDEFKSINDIFGHDVGDQFLQVITQRIKASIRDVDLAFRLGGDEFCIVLDDIVDEDQAIAVAERCLVEINQPMLLAETSLKPRVSVGIAIYPKDADNEHGLLKAADAAMYSAKSAGKQRLARYSPEMTTNAISRLKEEQMLFDAIDKHQFVLHYQPQINLLTGKIEGLEALLRWQHPIKGLVGPQEFVGLAESLGLINKLEDWVLNTACQQMMDWQQDGLPLVTLAVNISSLHLREKHLLDRLNSALMSSKLPPEYLEIEVTESAIQLEKDILIFSDIKHLGIKISINNFGSSYSSLASLNNIPLDCLKIDRRIVKDSCYDKNIPLILGALINIANANGYKLVAEGVETIDQLMIVSGLGCHIFQGYFFNKPVPPDQLPALFTKDYTLDQPVYGRRSKDTKT